MTAAERAGVARFIGRQTHVALVQLCLEILLRLASASHHNRVVGDGSPKFAGQARRLARYAGRITRAAQRRQGTVQISSERSA